MMLFPIMDVSVCILIKNQELCFPYFLANTSSSLSFDSRNSNRLELAFIVILICIFLITNDVGNFFTFFFSHCPSSHLLRYICSGALHFYLGWSFYGHGTVQVPHVFWILTPYHIGCLKIFSPILWVIFALLLHNRWLLFPVLQSGFVVQCHSTCLFLLLLPLLSGSHQKNHGPMLRSFRVSFQKF